MISLSPLVQYYHWVIDMEVIIVGLTWLLSQCVDPVDRMCPNHYLLCQEKILFYHIVCQCKSHSKFSFCHFDWCRKLRGIVIFHNSFLTDTVQESQDAHDARSVKINKVTVLLLIICGVAFLISSHWAQKAALWQCQESLQLHYSLL